MKNMKSSYANLLSEVKGMRETFRNLALEHYERKMKKREGKNFKINYSLFQIIIVLAFTIILCLGYYRKARENSINIPLAPVFLSEKTPFESSGESMVTLEY